MKRGCFSALTIGICIFVYSGIMGAGGIVQEEQINADGKILSTTPRIKMSLAPDIQVNSCWLSPTKWGSAITNIVRPGEAIYGVFDVTLSNMDTTLDRYYAIQKLSMTQTFSSHYYTGNALFSWGWEIPNETAKNKTKAAFLFTITAQGGNTVIKGLPFTVLRDAITDSTRAFQTPMYTWIKKKVINSCKTVNAYLKKSSLKFNSHYSASSSSADDFINTLKSYRPNAALIHAHGSSDFGGRIVLLDDTYIDADFLSSSGFTAPAGLFYAAVCEGAIMATLGNAFIAAGYDAFIGYQTSVFTDRNAAFYKYFFNLAKKPDKTVESALNDTIIWANNKAWTDVATARIIGDGSTLFLGSRTKSSSKEEKASIEKLEPVKIIPWKKFVVDKATAAERDAVWQAERIPEVRELRAIYNTRLKTGLETYPSVYRVAYKANGIYLYGVDIDKTTGSVVFHGTLD